MESDPLQENFIDKVDEDVPSSQLIPVISSKSDKIDSDAPLKDDYMDPTISNENGQSNNRCCSKPITKRRKVIIISVTVTVLCIIILILGLAIGLSENNEMPPISTVLRKLSDREKAEFVTGKDYWHLVGNKKFHIPEIMITDGPHGLRKKDPTRADSGPGRSVPSTCFPTAATVSCSWDPELIYEMGIGLAEECLEQRVSVLLGPGINIKRSPTGGRNFEYFSEDPFLVGELAVSYINGVQSRGVGTSLKHFAVNSQEKKRMMIDEVVDERAVREIYLYGFEQAVTRAKPWTVMNAYNKLNGDYCAQNSYLQNDLLEGKWGFEGLQVTDWGASVDRVQGLKTHTSLEMPSSGKYNVNKLLNALKSGDLTRDVLDYNVKKVLELIYRSKETSDKACKNNNHKCTMDHHELARKIAANSLVLLKNNENMLPLKEGKRIAVIGQMAKKPRYQGSGSSSINPIKIDNAYDSLVETGKYDITYAQGYFKDTDEINADLVNQAVDAASNAETVLLFIGLTESYEAEGYDRKNLSLPKNHNNLVTKIVEVNPNVIIVLSGGAPVEMPWVNNVKAILHGLLGGEASGSAVVDVLTGKVNPSGKLTETYPKSYLSIPFWDSYPATEVLAEHKESIYVGYRYYEKAGVDVLFPFGYGLSYTTFAYSNYKAVQDENDSRNITVSFDLKNTGSMYGGEVTQVYIAAKNSKLFRPVKEMKGFKKIWLEPGQTQRVTINLDAKSFQYFNVNKHEWDIEEGEYDILVGSSSRASDLTLVETVKVKTIHGFEIPDYSKTAPSYFNAKVRGISDTEWQAVLGHPIPNRKRDLTQKLTVYNSIGDSNHTKAGKIVNILVSVVLDIFLKGQETAMIKAMALEVPIRNFISMSMGLFTEDMANGLLLILNDEDIMTGIQKLIVGLIEMLPHIKELIDNI